MKEPSKLLTMMFEHDRWQDLLDNATEKEIDLKTIKELCYPENRMKLFELIYSDQYNIFPPHIAEIPKDSVKKVIVELNPEERKSRLLRRANRLPNKWQLKYNYCKSQAVKNGIDTSGFKSKDWKSFIDRFGSGFPDNKKSEKDIPNSKAWALSKISEISNDDIKSIEHWEEYFGIKNEPVVMSVPEYREVYVNEGMDRILLTLINDCLCELFGHMVHPQCKSYQKGIGTQKVVQDVSREIVKLGKIKKQSGYKSDFSKYFDTVKIEAIDNVFDSLEKQLGFEKNTEPVINLLRRYYHQDWYFDKNGKAVQKYQALKQGCAVASFLANVVLYELDEFMSRKYQIYYRYSDDVIVLDKNTSYVIDDMNSIIHKYGVKLNPKKVQPLCCDEWFTFLGFKIKGNMITLSQNRVDKFQEEVEKRSINRKKCTGKQARNAIIRFLYEGEYNWASSCLSTINVEPDIQELNKFVMDCIRACETGKKKVAGLGSVNHLPDRTILRGKGRNVTANREKTGQIENYLSVGCLRNNLRISKVVFETTVRNMKG